jgi:hypothetical protein
MAQVLAQDLHIYTDITLIWTAAGWTALALRKTSYLVVVCLNQRLNLAMNLQPEIAKVKISSQDIFLLVWSILYQN